MVLRRLASNDPDLPTVLALVRRSFAFMDGVIDPPSSMHRLTNADLGAQAATGRIWVIGDLVACVFLTPKDMR